MISAAEAVPSTVIEFVSRLTLHKLTPSRADTAFSTRAEQAAQLIPPISYLSISITFDTHIIYRFDGYYKRNKATLANIS